MSSQPVVWRNEHEFAAALDAWIERAHAATATGLKAAQEIVTVETQASFGVGNGPNNQSGALSGSITSPAPTPSGIHGYEAQVGPAGVEYARKIEIGKTGAHHGPPHPYLQPGLARAVNQIVAALAAAWADAGKG